MARWWVSWYQPTEDYRPLSSPPNEAILGWWCSGMRCADEASTLCALVHAASERAAKKAIQIDWPEAREWRFCETRPDDYLPADRFPVAPWMRQRIAELARKHTAKSRADLDEKVKGEG